MKKILTAVTAAALVAAPAVARAAAAPAPAAEPALGSQSESAQFENLGPAGYVIGAIVAGLLIWGFIELVDDDNKETVSPE